MTAKLISRYRWTLSLSNYEKINNLTNTQLPGISGSVFSLYAIISDQLQIKVETSSIKPRLLFFQCKLYFRMSFPSYMEIFDNLLYLTFKTISISCFEFVHFSESKTIRDFLEQITSIVCKRRIYANPNTVALTHFHKSTTLATSERCKNNGIFL